MHRNQRPSSPFPPENHRLLSLTAALVFPFIAIAVAGCGGPKQVVKSTPTPEEKAYPQNIQLTSGAVEAAQNFLQHTVTTVHGTVTNKGKKTVRYLEISLTFSDIEGKPIQQKTADAISTNAPPLNPGETRAFKVSFDEVSPVWNQAPPRMAPVRVILAGN
jgi:Protein of unknown function (DUF3426)